MVPVATSSNSSSCILIAKHVLAILWLVVPKKSPIFFSIICKAPPFLESTSPKIGLSTNRPSQTLHKQEPCVLEMSAVFLFLFLCKAPPFSLCIKFSKKKKKRIIIQDANKKKNNVVVCPSKKKH